MHEKYQSEHGEVELVPGTLRGYRCWRYYPPSGYLLSIGLPYLWFPAEIYSAECYSYGNEGESTNHSPPLPSCSCGYYASYDPTGYMNHISPRRTEWLIHGAISTHGRIVLGTEGFRAQHVAIDAFLNTPGYFAAEDIILGIASAYNVPLFESREDMLEKFPPSNMTELLGTRTP